MSGSPLGKYSVVGFNNLWNNVLLEMFNVDSWPMPTGRKMSWKSWHWRGKGAKDLGGIVNV